MSAFDWLRRAGAVLVAYPTTAGSRWPGDGYWNLQSARRFYRQGGAR